MNYNVKIIFSCDDGHMLDIKLASLLKKYSIPGLFFWPIECDMVKSKLGKSIAREFTIGSHTVTHPHLNEIESEEWLWKELNWSREYLQKKYVQPIEWLCYPRGRYSDEVIRVAQLAGYSYARTTVVGNVNKNDPPFEIKTAVHVYQRKEYDRDWLEYAKLKWLESRRVRGVYHIWGHSWEIDRDNNWDKLEELFKYIR
jgi:peptidoglycan-N-acetylglucosamine deacetylase